MGELYKTRDTRLDRIVAIKISGGQPRVGTPELFLTVPLVSPFAIVSVSPDGRCLAYPSTETVTESLGHVTAALQLPYAAGLQTSPDRRVGGPSRLVRAAGVR
jgi:hypothetical protein